MCIWKRQWHPTPVLLPGKSHGWRSLVGCSPWGREELDTTERLHFHFSLSCLGEGNGNPLQGSCLEDPRDGGAWWAAIYGVAQSRTRLKPLSSSVHMSVLPSQSSQPPLPSVPPGVPMSILCISDTALQTGSSDLCYYFSIVLMNNLVRVSFCTCQHIYRVSSQKWNCRTIGLIHL